MRRLALFALSLVLVACTSSPPAGTDAGSSGSPDTGAATSDAGSDAGAGDTGSTMEDASNTDAGPSCTVVDEPCADDAQCCSGLCDPSTALCAT